MSCKDCVDFSLQEAPRCGVGGLRKLGSPPLSLGAKEPPPLDQQRRSS